MQLSMHAYEGAMMFLCELQNKCYRTWAGVGVHGRERSYSVARTRKGCNRQGPGQALSAVCGFVCCKNQFGCHVAQKDLQSVDCSRQHGQWWGLAEWIFWSLNAEEWGFFKQDGRLSLWKKGNHIIKWVKRHGGDWPATSMGNISENEE